MTGAKGQPTVVTGKASRVRLARGAAKVNSVRFDAPVPDEGQPKPALSSLYLANADDESLGHPESIVVTIEPAS